MKKFLILSSCCLLFITGLAKAQVNCPIPCSQEEFPYLWCQNGVEVSICSSDPNSEGGDLVKAYLPDCIHVDQTSTSGVLTGMPFVGKTQAYGPVPGPEPISTCGDDPFPGTLSLPNKWAIYEQYINGPLSLVPWQAPYDSVPGDWGDDYSAYEAAWAQWDQDSSDFFNGYWPSPIDTSGMDDNAKGAVHEIYIADYDQLDDIYISDYGIYQDDSTQHAQWAICDSAFQVEDSEWQVVCHQVEYVTVWDDAQAQADANAALSQWYSACPGIQKNDCCVRVNFDQNVLDFRKSDYSLNSSIPFDLALTPLPPCQSAGCPDSDSLYINVNVSFKLLFASNLDDPLPDANYPQSVSSRTFFTGDTPPTTNSGFEAYSFRYMIEHELGHWFGFSHTDLYRCYNNIDTCKGFGSVMESEEDHNIYQGQVTCEDKNMFRKLYCPDQPCQGCVAAVSTSITNVLNAIVFPNPTTGASLLEYRLPEYSRVQVAIFDLLGNQIKLVSSGFEEPGIQSVSLGTESLPQGHYVCRIQISGNVITLNVNIVR